MSERVWLTPGDPAPLFHQRSQSNPRFAFDTAAGRYVVLGFLGSAGELQSQATLAAVRARPELFDDRRACVFAVSIDPRDEAEQRVAESYPGYRVFWDFDLGISRLYGSVARDAKASGEVKAIRLWVVLDPTLRVLAVLPFPVGGEGPADALLAFLESLPPPERYAGVELQAPVILLPNVLEPELCERLVRLWDEGGAQASGFMRDVDGKTVQVMDPAHKRRKDVVIEDAGLIKELQTRFRRRVAPEIAKVHQFHVTRMERYIVAGYEAEDQGHFRAHRDNTTKGTAHRRFAVSVNLNDGFDGGDVRFPSTARAASARRSAARSCSPARSCTRSRR
jgi:peroxiredoxin